jgi:phosphotransferase system  glucose/maltose/N-acetylglucosamine-specific IIC component
MSVSDILNTSLLVLTALSVWLITSNDKQVWGFGVGLLIQPIWFALGITTESWALCILAVWFTYCYIKGIYAKTFK